jgi:ribosomal protein S18 acetylase RimI-like enzyme
MGSVMLKPKYQRRGIGSSLVMKSVELFSRGTRRHNLSGLLRRFSQALSILQQAELGFTSAAVVPQEDYRTAVFHWSLGGHSATMKKELS